MQCSVGVLPVVDLMAIVGTQMFRTDTVVVSSTGQKEIFTVPQGKRYTVNLVYAFMQTGTFTINQALVKDQAGIYAYMVTQTGATSLNYTGLHKDIIMDSGVKLCINVDSYTGSGNLVVQTYYKEENL